MSEEAKWYVVHTYSGYENKVASNLEKAIENSNLNNMIQNVKIPTEEVTEIKDGKERKIERKVFPGYVFIKMILNDRSWHIVRNIRGCTGFVGSSTEPTPLTEAEAKSLGVELKTIKLSPHQSLPQCRIYFAALCLALILLLAWFGVFTLCVCLHVAPRSWGLGSLGIRLAGGCWLTRGY